MARYGMTYSQLEEESTKHPKWLGLVHATIIEESRREYEEMKEQEQGGPKMGEKLQGSTEDIHRWGAGRESNHKSRIAAGQAALRNSGKI